MKRSLCLLGLALFFVFPSFAMMSRAARKVPFNAGARIVAPLGAMSLGSAIPGANGRGSGEFKEPGMSKPRWLKRAGHHMAMLATFSTLALSINATNADASSAGTLQKLETNAWPYLSVLDEQGKHIFTIDNDGFVNGFIYGDGFSLTKLWEYPFAAKKMSYEGNYLLLSNEHSHIVLEAGTGQLISQFIYRSTGISMKLVILDSQVVIGAEGFEDETSFVRKYLDIKTQAEIKRISFHRYKTRSSSNDFRSYEDAILWDTNSAYIGASSGIVKAFGHQSEELWATELEFSQDTPIAQIMNIGKDMIGIIPKEKSPNLYVLNKYSGKILKTIKINKEYATHVPVAQDEQRFYVSGDDKISVYSKSDLKRIWAIKIKNSWSIAADDKYIYISYNKSGIGVYDKATFEFLGGVNRIGNSSADYTVEEFFIGPNHSLAAYVSAYSSGCGPYGGGGGSSEFVNTYKFNRGTTSN